jgi:hypothetical protein
MDCFVGAGAMSLLSRSRNFGEAPQRILRGINARGASVLVGVVLLTAAALKTHQLATGPTAENSLFTSRWLLIALVELELALGLWLLSGAYPGLARLAALAAFAGFCLASLYQALTGAPSCGCFGNVHINPWYTLLFDLAAVVVLWRWTSAAHVNICWGGGGARSHSFRLIAFGLFFLLAGIPAAIAMSSPHSVLLQCSTPAIDFGTMPQAEHREITFWLLNPSQKTVEIAETKSSCECFHVDFAQRTVAGGEKIQAVARLELDKEPWFTGQLQLEAQGKAASGAIAFSIQAHVRVVRR